MADRHDLLAESRPLIGRDVELAELATRMGEHRLVTIVGAAGVGKTTIARRAGIGAARRNAGGVWLCDLTEAVTADDVCRVLALALGVPLSATGMRGGHAGQLGRALSGRGRVLLVLDNMEQLTSHAAATLGVWLEAAPEARFLVTSRELLRLPGEHVFELGSLPSDDAIALFLERARAAGHAAVLRDEDAPAIAELVRELDGLPLAIELAAARLGVMTPAQIVEHLPQRFELLTRGARGASGRPRTLRDAIHASWTTLSTEERATLSQSSVFRGGLSLEAAQRVLDIGSATLLVDVLQGLREKSLLRAEREGSEVRFGLLVSIRAFASTMLAPDDAAAATARHASYFVSAARVWSKGISRAGGGAVMARMRLELDNLLAVVTRGLERPDPEATTAAFEVLLALEPVFSMHGPFSTYIGLLELASSDALARVTSPRLIVLLLSARGRALCASGRSEEAHDVLERAVSLALASSLRAEEARARSALGLVHRQSGRAAQAEAEYARALELTSADDDEGVGDLLLKQGNLELSRGRLDAAGDAYERGLGRLKAAGDLRRTGWCLGNLAIVRFSTGEDPRDLYLRSIEIARDLGEHRAEAFNHGNLAQLQQESEDIGEREEAHASYRRAATMLRDVGDERAVARVLLDWGTLFHEEGRLEEARKQYREAVAMLREVGDRRVEGFAIACSASADVALGKIDRAAASYDEAERLLREADDRFGPATVDVHRALLDIARGERDAALARLSRANALSDRPIEIRFAIRLLERALAAGAPRTLRVGAKGDWFELAASPRAELSHGSPLRRLLLRLAEAHAKSPGQALDVADLLANGWPGERVLPKAGANRVRVALASLRKLGLREPLVGKRGGWLLDPGWAVAIEPD